MTKRPRPASVREPVQVYLAPDDRLMLDRLARETGLSRAELLRRGIRTLAAGPGRGASPMLLWLDEVGATGWPDGVAAGHDDFLAREYSRRTP